MKVKSCGVIPILKQKNRIKFLLIQHQLGHWAFPKGKIKQSEIEIETAERELKEETDIKNFEILNDICFTEKYSFEKDGQKYDKMVKYFLAWVRNPEIKILKSELKSYKWLGFEKAIKLITYEETKNTLRQVNEHLIQQDLSKIISKFSGVLPKFPDGRINYTNSKIAPVLTIFVLHKNKLLLLKRSNQVGTYKNKWSVVTGYLDELKSIKEKVTEELKEELKINKKDILSIHLGQPYNSKDKFIKKTLIIHPVLVKIKKTPKIKLDWEHIKFKWINPDKLTNFNIVYNLDRSFKHALLS